MIAGVLRYPNQTRRYHYFTRWTKTQVP